MHYLHVFAVKDRINFSHLSSNAEMVCFDNIDFGVFYPNLDDEAKLVLNFETLVTRMLVKHIPGNQHLFPHVTHHIQHKHSRNMSQKSTPTNTYTHAQHTQAHNTPPPHTNPCMYKHTQPCIQTCTHTDTTHVHMHVMHTLTSVSCRKKKGGAQDAICNCNYQTPNNLNL